MPRKTDLNIDKHFVDFLNTVQPTRKKIHLSDKAI